MLGCERAGLVDSEVTFCSRGKKEILKNFISVTWHSVIIIFCYYSPWRKGSEPSFQHIGFLFAQGYFVPSLVKIGQVVLY